MPRLVLGLIDSGIAGSLSASVAASRCFVVADDGEVRQADAAPDQLGHGTALAAILLQGAPDGRLLNAQVFRHTLACGAAQVAAALDWLVQQRAQLVNMSFGLREDRPSLRNACERALAQGVILVAATPARGEPVFPAAYAGVIRATGDARCAPGELSFLDTRQADFGGHVRAGAGTVAGASVGCAHVAARAAGFLGANPGSSAAQLRAWLEGQASYRGPERRVC
jgi:subtilisin family serine protease